MTRTQWKAMHAHLRRILFRNPTSESSTMDFTHNGQDYLCSVIRYHSIYRSPYHAAYQGTHLRVSSIQRRPITQRHAEQMIYAAIERRISLASAAMLDRKTYRNAIAYARELREAA